MSTSITDVLHSIPVDPLTGAINIPVYQTSTFVQQAPGVNQGYDYARTGNPTRHVLENIVAKLENGIASYAFSSGIAAIDAVLKLLKSGDEILAVDDIYGGAYRILTKIYNRFDITVRFVDTTDVTTIKSQITSKTRMIWLESPTNPTLKVCDISAISKIAKEDSDVLVVVDNTFASPIAQRPLDLGADIVIHSATKYLSGHCDVVAGIAVTNSVEISKELKFLQNGCGAILGPWDCFLAIRGIETLELRYLRQCENAFCLAQFLAKHPAVDKVHYPGLPYHKNHEIAKQQQNGLFGGMISFSLKNDTIENAEQIVTSTTYFKLAESLGGVKSLISLPCKMTHVGVPREKRLASGIQDSLIRLSVGIENVEDLINDLKNVLGQS